MSDQTQVSRDQVRRHYRDASVQGGMLDLK